jgi:sugar O-acyltransferase (sialic acid O-acetyltransferase NeuD family)
MNIKHKKAIIVGTGPFAELAHFYLDVDSPYNIVAFCESEPTQNEFCSKKVIAIDDIAQYYPSDEYDVFVAIGYRRMNDIRKDVCEDMRKKGYHLLSYISSKATFWNHENHIGDNVFVFEDNTIQPFTSIGDGTILWSGNHIGHHAMIGNYCFISSHCVVSGHCHIDDCCFLGVNCTIQDSIKIAQKNLIGAGVIISKNTNYSEVYLSEKHVASKITSNKLMR